jgi:hypothetical protein
MMAAALLLRRMLVALLRRMLVTHGSLAWDVIIIVFQ